MKNTPIAASELKSALSGFSRIISRHTTLPVLGCVRLTTNPNGSVHLTATNLDDFATYAFQSPSSLEPIDVLIPFDPLSKIIKGCSADETITIRAKEKDLTISYPVGSSALEQGFQVIAIEEFPGVPQVKEYDSVTVGQEFKDAILAALSCSSTDASRLILHNAYVDVSDPKAHYVVGTDGHHLFSANSFLLEAKASFTVPNRRFLTWKGFIEDGDWKITLPAVEKDSNGNEKPAFIKVQSDRWTLITRKCDQEYPNWRAPIPSPQHAKTVVTLNDEAVEFIRKAAPRLPGSNQTSKGVTIRANRSVLLSGNDGTHAAAVPVVGAVAEGEPVNVSLSRTFLIKAMEMQLKELHIIDPMSPMVFSSGGKRLVVMPLRPDAPVPHPPQNQRPTAPEQASSSPAPAPTNEEEQRNMKTNTRIEQISTETTTNGAAEPKSAFEQVQEKLEQTRTALRDMITDLGDCLKLLAQAQRERRGAEKEIDEVRATLQSLQKIRI